MTPLSDEELVRLARSSENKSVFFYLAHEIEKLRALREAVLNRFEKKARKVEGWVNVYPLENGAFEYGVTGIFPSLEAANSESADARLFACYVTGIEGIEPKNAEPKENKQHRSENPDFRQYVSESTTEKREGREFWVREYVGPAGEKSSTLFPSEFEARSVCRIGRVGGRIFRVREIIEGERE